jgi:REP element-mobilizing transposase RayT
MINSEPNPGLQRVGFQLRADGIPQEPPNKLRSGIHSRGYLPHVKREGANYFVTFRLGDSLPREVLLEFQRRRAERVRALAAAKEKGPRDQGEDSMDMIERDYRREVESFLDGGAGACWLRRPEIAELVANALQFFDGERYCLRTWTVMPNHVHAIVWPQPGCLLGEILHSWKRFTSREANRRLGRVGEDFWQRESYDHWIRDDVELSRIVRYIENNPVKAGLCRTPEEWRWSSAGCRLGKVS